MIECSSLNRKEKPLIVDLDGTLIKTDLLFESANLLVGKKPWKLGVFVSWVFRGKSELKERLAKAIDISPSSLPYNEEVIEWLRQQKKEGRYLILATGANNKLAHQISDYLGLFDEVYASDKDTNLTGRIKRDLLIRKFGQFGFDYIGDSNKDRPIWAICNKAYIVNPSKKNIELVKKNNKLDGTFEVRHNGNYLLNILTAMRPYQWSKNLLIFVPIVGANMYGNNSSIFLSIAAFFIFSIVASSIYLFNDLVDINSDRLHPRKKTRPFAAGDLSIIWGWLLWPTLLLLSFTLSIVFLPYDFSYTLAIYIVFTLSYTLYLKKQPIVDVMTLASLYTLRIIAGAEVIAAPLTFWLLSFSIFIFLSLAFVKRYSELKGVKSRHGLAKIHGRGYIGDDLEVVSAMGVGAGYLSVLVFALYVQELVIIGAYKSPEILWLACLFLLYWISRMWLIAHRGVMHDDPIVFSLKDWVSWFIAFLFILVFFLAKNFSR